MSYIRSFSQIPTQSKFLIATGEDVCGNTVEESSAFTGEWTGSIVEYVSGSLYAFNTGALFREIGRQMMIVDAAGKHLALFREALPQTNAATEGVAAAPIWIRVWAADGAAVRVARLG